MHPARPHRSTVSPTADRSLGSALVTNLLAVIVLLAALVTASTAAAVVSGPPVFVAAAAIGVGFATVLAVPIGAVALGRWLHGRIQRHQRRLRERDRHRRRRRPPTADDPKSTGDRSPKT